MVVGCGVVVGLELLILPTTVISLRIDPFFIFVVLTLTYALIGLSTGVLW